MIEKRHRRDRKGKNYLVLRIRWRDDAGQEHSKTLPRGTRMADAEAYELRVKTLKSTGELPALDRGRETLSDFVSEWWELYAGPNLALSTLERYSQVWNAHMLDRIGGLRLREVTPETVTRFRVDLERAGVGAPTVLKALTLLQGILSRAVEWQRISRNPVAAVPKPKAERSREVVLLSPERVEAMRRHVLELDRYGRGLRDATLLSVLAYAGLRPWSEAARLTWAAVGQRTLLVHAPKTRRERTVDLPQSLHQDLAAWRMASGRPDAAALVFPGPTGEAWSGSDVRNWRDRVFTPALHPCGLDESMVPYDLRHACASLLIYEGRSVVEIAEQMGHAPTMALDTYGHVIRDLREAPRVSTEEQIRAARANPAAHTRPTGVKATGS